MTILRFIARLWNALLEHRCDYGDPDCNNETRCDHCVRDQWEQGF